MGKSYDTLNSILVGLFNEIMDIEEKAIISGEFCDISNNDMHIIEAIKDSTINNMSTISKRLAVTMGTLTTTVNSLIKKGYVSRERSEEDRRVVYVSLTDKGERAYERHQTFHHEMIEAVVKDMKEDEEEILIGTLNRLRGFFDRYKNEGKHHQE